MRILLMTSPLGRLEPPIFPLGLAYLGSSLANHEVIYFDAAIAESPLPALAKVIDEFKPEVIGLSLRNIDTLESYDSYSYWPAFVETVKWLRSRWPSTVLVVGGSGFSLFARKIMERLPELDFGVYLEGERAFPELLECLDHPEAVKGIYLWRGDQVLFTGEREFADFDAVASPRRDILALAPYRSLEAVGVQTKRGCAFDCLYCTYPFISGGRLRLRSPEKVGEEVQVLRREYGRKEIFFSDNVFNWPASHAEAICQELLRRNLDIRWKAYFTERGMTADFARLALESGCVTFSFSPDGCNDASLGALRKGMSRAELEATYRLLDDLAGAKYKCHFIYNCPQTGWRDLRDLCGLIFRLMRMRNLAGITLSTMRILPHTGLQELAVREGRIGPDDDLLRPTFYDPFPWRLFSLLMDGVGRVLKEIKVLTGKTVFSRRSGVTGSGRIGPKELQRRGA
jgi:anaerobic magnesium-protoporphyrin IX monomethyl ester cyclase